MISDCLLNLKSVIKNVFGDFGCWFIFYTGKANFALGIAPVIVQWRIITFGLVDHGRENPNSVSKYCATISDCPARNRICITVRYERKRPLLLSGRERPENGTCTIMRLMHGEFESRPNFIFIAIIYSMDCSFVKNNL